MRRHTGPHPTLHTMLKPTLTNPHHLDLVITKTGRPAILPLHPLTPHQLRNACHIHQTLNRGLLITT
jgi:hypothetical protein